MLETVSKCLKRQYFTDFEWIIPTPLSQEEIGKQTQEYVYLHEPPKRKGDYYGLNKAYNAAFKQAKGSLIVSIQDGVWFPPSLLDQFWVHFCANPLSIISALGDQYERMEYGKPEQCMWKDPRKRTDFGSFYEVEPSEIEFCVSSFPKQAVEDVGGLDETFDQYAAISEKEMTYRMQAAGYKCFLDQGMEYRALHHERLNAEWEARFQSGCTYYAECLKQILKGERKNLRIYRNSGKKE